MIQTMIGMRFLSKVLALQFSDYDYHAHFDVVRKKLFDEPLERLRKIYIPSEDGKPEQEGWNNPHLFFARNTHVYLLHGQSISEDLVGVGTLEEGYGLMEYTYYVLQRFAGQGYGFYLAQKLLQKAQTFPGAFIGIATVHSNNIPSLRVNQKLHQIYDGDVTRSGNELMFTFNLQSATP